MREWLANVARAAIALLASAACLPSAARAVPLRTTTAGLLIPKEAHVAPAGDSGVVRHVSMSTPIYGAPTVLSVTASRAGQPTWLRVRLPGRPNGTAGWMTNEGVRLSSTPWFIQVSLPQRMVRVYRHGRLVRSMRAVIGAPATPTPAGTFSITEQVPQPLGSAIGSYALALNAYSPTLQEFDGGPGQIAIHGTGHLSGHLGEAASSGCVRVTEANLLWLAHHLSAGVVVSIAGPSAREAMAEAASVQPPALTSALQEAGLSVDAGALDSLMDPFSPFSATA